MCIGYCEVDCLCCLFLERKESRRAGSQSIYILQGDASFTVADHVNSFLDSDTQSVVIQTAWPPTRLHTHWDSVHQNLSVNAASKLGV